MAAEEGHAQVIELLVELRSDVNTTDKVHFVSPSFLTPVCAEWFKENRTDESSSRRP